MTSAFGVDHGYVSKSFVPGQGFKAANKLDDVERHIVRNATLGGKAARTKTGSSEKKAVRRQGEGKNRTKIYEGVRTDRGKLTKVVANRRQTGAGPQVQGFSQPDGRGGGRVVIHDDADFKTTARHEMAHITPKRNPVRFFERTKDSNRLGREEGRADFVASGKQTAGQYPGNDQFKRGYNEVQGRMAAAKWRKDNR